MLNDEGGSTLTLCRSVAVFVLAAVPWVARGESVTYELYQLSDGGQRVLLSKGQRQYSPKDVLVQERGSGASRTWSKEIPIANGFSAGVSIFPEQDLKGFGLWLKDRESSWGKLSAGGFSWDWFNRQDGSIYRKLQGAGRVRVTFSQASQFQEIASIEVLEDMTLRAQVRPWFISFFSVGDTHHLVVRKGSVLRFAP